MDDLVCSQAILRPRASLAGGNCRGDEKVRRISLLESYPHIDWPNSWVYSDSLSDLPLFQLSGNPVAVNPQRPLRNYARAHGWTILDWED